MRKKVLVPAIAAACAAVIAGALSNPATAAQPAAVPAPAAVNAPLAPATFTHPGVGVSRAQLDFIRAKVQAGAQPWTNAYNQAKNSNYASLSRTPTPRAVVECGPYSQPNYGCTNEREDAIAAYTDALIWYISRDDRYAQKAIALMDAWSNDDPRPHQQQRPAADRLGGVVVAQGGRDHQACLRQLAELRPVRHDAAQRLRPGDHQRLELQRQLGADASSRRCRESASSSRTGRSTTRRSRCSATAPPAYVYLESDGALPKTVPSQNLNTRDKIVSYWQGQGTFVTGLTQETCRDFVHTGYGISAISHVLETGRIQGIDMYPQYGERLRQALGFQSRWERNLEPVPSWLCGGTVKRGLGPITEVGYNALHTRLGIAMANTQALTESKRPAGSNNLFVAWETLTHAENPS